VSNIYLKLGSIAGPISAGNLTPPPGQPQGFSPNGVFPIYDSVGGVAAPAPVFTQGAGGVSAPGLVTPGPFSIAMANNTAGPDLFQAVAMQTKHNRACIMMTANATGGIATEWIQSYWLLRDVIVSSMQTQISEPPGYLQIDLGYSALMVAFFATPSGGVLGARRDSGYDFVTKTPWSA
jgi:type VI protein secretion system component Hcp